MQHCEHLFLGQNQFNFDIGINYNLQAKVKKISKPFFGKMATFWITLIHVIQINIPLPKICLSW